MIADAVGRPVFDGASLASSSVYGGLLLDRAALEAAQALQRILRPDDRFAELAVAYDIDAAFACWRFGVGDRLRQAIFVNMTRVLTSRVIN